ncbi:DUF6702 family protein [Kordiimonas sp. SCSIO 12610]|uniref:DUF6702 family protein n=1 Tax=Kordiimonas sp. SCSIO 12610 TaxID=2829597 RepID=UPI00210E68EA|nr:DUF6702 family protein [Kordiimonas sp. SCSIO 12610]UTW56656.1 hypothetical protein KFF44_07135 [Kordiimonas sp. SCSIO 12610]
MHFHSRILLTILLFTAIFSASYSLIAHSSFTSFTRIDWNKNDQSIELVMQMHAHELEAYLSEEVGERLSFLVETDLPTLETAAGPAILRNLSLELDGKKVSPSFLGLELQGQTVFLYMESDWQSQPKRLSFLNKLFFNVQPGQINSMMAVVNGRRQAGEATPGDGPIELEF